MCTHKSWIYNSRGRKILVDCGKCPSCLQSKAISRTNKIKDTFLSDGSLLALFVTLTYSNDCIPYIDYSELLNSFPCRNLSSPSYRTLRYSKSFSSRRVFDDDILSCVSQNPNKRNFTDPGFRSLNIYRDSVVRFNRVSRSYKFSRCKSRSHRQLLSEVTIPEFVSFDKLRFLKSKNFFIPNKVGVVYYSDVQNFIKRLKINLKRYYGVQNNFKYFSCAEYGPTSLRPHFHLLIFCPRDLWKIYKAAIVKSWPYDDYNFTRRNISIAKNASSYVSSYVNCFSSLPPLFASVKELSPKCSYSHSFGFGLELYKLPSIVEKVYAGDLRITRSVVKQHCLTDASMLLPKYVLYRTWPKFKGYYRLTSDEVASLLARPSRIYEYAHKLDYDSKDAYSTFVRLTNCKSRALTEISESDYVFCGSRVWSVYSANVLSDFYTNVLSNQNLIPFAYDNILDFFTGNVVSLSLDSFCQNNDCYHIYDPNLFPHNVQSTFNLERAFHSYSKDRKVRNSIYSNFLNV